MMDCGEARECGEQDMMMAPKWAAWRAEEVRGWLSETVGLPQYADDFVGNEVDGPTLPELNDEVLREHLGVSNALHRKKILGHTRLLLCSPRSPDLLSGSRTSQDLAAAVGSASTACPDWEERQAVDTNSTQAVDTSSTIVISSETGEPSYTGCQARLAQVMVQQPSSAQGKLRIAQGGGAMAQRAAMRTVVTDELLRSAMGFGPLPRTQAVPPVVMRSSPRAPASPETTYSASSPSYQASSPSPRPRAAFPSPEHRSPRQSRRSEASQTQVHRQASVGGLTRTRSSASCTRLNASMTSSSMCSTAKPTSPTSGGANYNLMGSNKSVASLTNSPRATIAKAPRSSGMPNHGKLAWQTRPAEETPGVAYSSLPQDFGKPRPGGAIGSAPRFAPGVENCPVWLLERGASQRGSSP